MRGDWHVYPFPLALEQHEKREEMSFVPTAQAVLNSWIRILSALEKKITRQAFEQWLKPTRFSHQSGKTLYVRIPSAKFEEPLERYGDLIYEAIERLGLEIEAVKFQTPQQDPAAPKMREDGGFAPLPSHSPNAPKPPQEMVNGGVGGGINGAGVRVPGPEQSRFDCNTATQLNAK